MPLSPPHIVNVTAPVTRPFPKQMILWPTFSGYGEGGGSDSIVFPELTAIKARMAACPPDALTAFVNTAWMAQDRILVLDDYLFKPEKPELTQNRYDQILSWLPDNLVANDVRFLTNALGDQGERRRIHDLFNERIDAINRNTPRRVGKVKIEIRFSLGKEFPYMHDRFAIIDNELWHFGATVGGLHSHVNAATRGWDAEAHGAVRFFDKAWEGDDDVRHGDRHG